MGFCSFTEFFLSERKRACLGGGVFAFVFTHNLQAWQGCPLGPHVPASVPFMVSPASLAGVSWGSPTMAGAGARDRCSHPLLS